MKQALEYRKTEVNTSDNVRIVSLLYDGAINFIKIARTRLEEGDIAGKGLFVGKATGVVAELSSSLNMEAGGEIAGNLKRLYDYILDRLLYGNMNNDAVAFDEAEKVLDILRSAWKEIETRKPHAPVPADNARMELRA
ncbi:MAG: flagellar export chaperone FliS [Nitrospirae bacterium]|nr:flagellar export chaperone FliS [Nitrospirota bacterium]